MFKVFVYLVVVRVLVKPSCTSTGVVSISRRTVDTVTVFAVLFQELCCQTETDDALSDRRCFIYLNTSSTE